MTYLKLKKLSYTPKEVADLVGVSRQTIVKWCNEGKLEHTLTKGGHHRIPARVFTDDGNLSGYQLVKVNTEVSNGSFRTNI